MSIVKLNNRGVRSATAFGSISALGEMRFIKKQTASSSATISFVHGTSDVVLDDTYKEYLFTFNNMHPSGDDVVFSFQASTDGGSNYNTAATTTLFRAVHNEADSATALGYETAHDEAQTTGFIDVDASVGGDADQHACGTMQIFNPSSSVFVKHFMYKGQSVSSGDFSVNTFMAGYFNTTSAINAVQFKFASGNIDAGDICLYGIN
jgi:hypothetical protein